MANVVRVGEKVQVISGKHARSIGKVLSFKGYILQVEVDGTGRRIWVGVDEISRG